MDEREQQRKIKHRLAVLRHVEEVSGNVAATCRYYGISRPTFYKWLRQYEELGEEGLRDRSSRPRTCPHQTEVVWGFCGGANWSCRGPAAALRGLRGGGPVGASRDGTGRVGHAAVRITGRLESCVFGGPGPLIGPSGR